MLTEVLRRAFGQGPFSPREAAEVLGIKNPASTLNRLKCAGILESPARGSYRFTPDDRPLVLSRYLLREAMASSRATRIDDLAELARKRWIAWQESGYVVAIAPRRYRLSLTRPRRPLAVRRK